MDKYDRFFLKIKISFVVFLIAFVMAGRYGIPYIFEKYGMPGEAVVTNVERRGSHGTIVAQYEFTVDGNFYTGSVPSTHVQKGDTIQIWYFLSIPWINECHEEAVVR